MSDTASLPILLIPGLGCTARLYTEQMPALWTFGPVTVADHRRADSMDAIARQILDTAPPRFALAGLSMGGYIALAIMRIAPDRVAKLALLDTGSRSDTSGRTWPGLRSPRRTSAWMSSGSSSRRSACATYARARPAAAATRETAPRRPGPPRA